MPKLGNRVPAIVGLGGVQIFVPLLFCIIDASLPPGRGTGYRHQRLSVGVAIFLKSSADELTPHPTEHETTGQQDVTGRCKYPKPEKLTSNAHKGPDYQTADWRANPQRASLAAELAAKAAIFPIAMGEPDAG